MSEANLQFEHDNITRLCRNVRGVEEQLARAADNHRDYVALESSRRGRWAIGVRGVYSGPGG
jgi:hypothetical protein